MSDSLSELSGRYELMRAKIDELETRLENLPEMKRRLSELAELIKQAVSEQPTPQSPSTEQESGESVQAEANEDYSNFASSLNQMNEAGQLPNGSTEQPVPETD